MNSAPRASLKTAAPAARRLLCLLALLPALLPAAEPNSVWSVACKDVVGDWDDKTGTMGAVWHSAPRGQVFNNPVPGSWGARINPVNVTNNAVITIRRDVSPEKLGLKGGTINTIQIGDNFYSNATYFSGNGTLIITSGGKLDTTPALNALQYLNAAHISIPTWNRARGGSRGHFIVEGNGIFNGGATWIGRIQVPFSPKEIAALPVNKRSVSGELTLRDQATYLGGPFWLGVAPSVLDQFHSAGANPDADITGTLNLIGSKLTVGISDVGRDLNDDEKYAVYHFNSSGVINFVADKDGLSTLDLFSNAGPRQKLSIGSPDTARNRAFRINVDLSALDFPAALAKGPAVYDLIKVRGFATPTTFETPGAVTFNVRGYDTARYAVKLVQLKEGRAHTLKLILSNKTN